MGTASREGTLGQVTPKRGAEGGRVGAALGPGISVTQVSAFGRASLPPQGQCSLCAAARKGGSAQYLGTYFIAA